MFGRSFAIPFYMKQNLSRVELGCENKIYSSARLRDYWGGKFLKAQNNIWLIVFRGISLSRIGHVTQSVSHSHML